MNTTEPESIPPYIKYTISLLIIVLIFGVIYIHFYTIRELNSIHIALLAPMSGKDKETGQAFYRGVTLCLDRVNRTGGINGHYVKVDLFDDKSNSYLAEKEAKNLIDEKVVAVVGPAFDEECFAASKIYKEQHIPAIAPIARGDMLTPFNPWQFRIGATDKTQAHFLAAYMYHVMDLKSINVITDGDYHSKELSRVFKDELLKHGGEINKSWLLDLKNEEEHLQSILKGLKTSLESKPLFLALTMDNAIAAVTYIKDNNIDVPIYGTSMLADPNFLKAFQHLQNERLKKGFYTNRLHLIHPFLLDSANQYAFELGKEYNLRYGEQITYEVIAAYDATKVILHACQKMDVSGKKSNRREDRQFVQQFLTKMNKLNQAIEGATGLLYFDEKGDAFEDATLGVYYHDKLITEYAKLQFVANVKDLETYQEYRQNMDLIEVEDKYYSKAAVVFTGIEIVDIKDLNTENFDTTMDFYLWFRYREITNINPAHILFQNTYLNSESDDIPVIGDPIIQNNQGGIIYELYRIHGRFKSDFAEDTNWSEHSIGIIFQHYDKAINDIHYVVDQVGGASTTEATHQTNLNKLSWYIQNKYNWEITTAKAFTNQDVKPIMGNTLLVLKEEDSINFSQFVLALYLKSSTLNLRGKIPMPYSLYLLILCIFLFVIYIIERKTEFFNKRPRVVWIIQSLCIITIILALESLALNILNTKLHKYQMTAFYQFNSVVWWILFASLAASAVNRFIWIPLENITGNKIPHLIRATVSFTIYLISMFCIISFVFDYKITGLLASTGVAAMIVGLAVQINLSNIVSGIALNIDRPFQIGDWIKIGDDKEGKVIDVGWRSTRIKTWEECILSVPNSAISESNIHNWSSPDNIFWLWPSVQIDPRHPPEIVIKVIKEAMLSVEGVIKDPEPFVYTVIAVWSVDYTFVYGVADYKNRHKIASDVWSSVWHHLDKAGVDLGTESREVYHYRGSEKGPREGIFAPKRKEIADEQMKHSEPSKG